MLPWNQLFRDLSGDVVSLAIFDLDNTLLGGDSDAAWGEFVAQRGLVDSEWYARKNFEFYEHYKQGTLDIFEFLRFSLKVLADYPLEQLHAWRREFIEEKVRPMLLPKAAELLTQHREQGDILLIITATNRFITEPIAELLGVDHLLATDPELTEQGYTGKVSGIPCFQEGKVQRLEAWLQGQQMSLEGSWFYSDSHNDLPLLERVDHAVAVDPDEVLRREAQARGWQVMSLR